MYKKQSKYIILIIKRIITCFIILTFLGNFFVFLIPFYQIELKNDTNQPINVIIKTDNDENIHVSLASQQTKIVTIAKKGDASYVLDIQYPDKNIIKKDNYVSVTSRYHKINIHPTDISESEQFYFGF